MSTIYRTQMNLEEYIKRAHKVYSHKYDSAITLEEFKDCFTNTADSLYKKGAKPSLCAKVIFDDLA